MFEEQVQQGVMEELEGFLRLAESQVDAAGPVKAQTLPFEDFLTRKLKIQTKDRRLIRFRPNKTQRVTLAVIRRLRREKKPIRIICNKTRQGGFSTITEAYLFWDTITHQNTNSLVCAHELGSSKHLFGISKRYWENLPDPERPHAQYSNRQELVFDQLGSRFIVDTANKKMTLDGAEAGSLGRSFTIQNFHASEVAFWPDAEVMMDSVMAAVPDHAGTSIFIESTPNTIGDYFFREWERAMKGETDFVPIFVPWFWVEEYARPLRTPYPPFRKTAGGVSLELDDYEADLVERHGVTEPQINWMRWKTANSYRGDKTSFQKNFPSTAEEGFVGSHSPYFDMGKVRDLLKSSEEAPIRGNLSPEDAAGRQISDEPYLDHPPRILLRRDKRGFVKLWGKPVKHREYVIGADVGEGIALDAGRVVGSYSAAVVFDRETKFQAASWHGHTDPDSFGDELYRLGHYFNTAWVVCEVNNHGLTTLTRLKRLGYPKIYYRFVLDEKSRKRTRKIGWLTNLQTREYALDFLVKLIREGTGELCDPDLLRECSTFIKNFKRHGRGEKAAGCFDDLVLAAAIALAGDYHIGMIEREEKEAEEYIRSAPPDEYGRFGLSREFCEAVA